jgi:hypothetical protein
MRRRGIFFYGLCLFLMVSIYNRIDGISKVLHKSMDGLGKLRNNLRQYFGKPNVNTSYKK